MKGERVNMADKTTITKERITPEIATEMLKSNVKNNRSVSVSRLQMYTHDMLSGDWIDNTETIKFDRHGNLIDGQHRLRAIVASGCTEWMWVARGIADDAFKTIDVGMTRTPRQIFQMTEDPLKHNRSITAIVAFSFRACGGGIKCTQGQMDEFVDTNRELLEWCYSTIRGANSLPAHYLMAAIAMHLNGIKDSEIAWFIDGAAKNNFDPHKPVNALKYCILAENHRKNARSFSIQYLQDITRCAYSYVNNLQRLSQKEDAYPIQMNERYKLIKG